MYGYLRRFDCDLMHISAHSFQVISTRHNAMALLLCDHIISLQQKLMWCAVSCQTFVVTLGVSASWS